MRADIESGQSRDMRTPLTDLVREVYLTGRALPEEMRLPRAHGVEDRTLWLEDVPAALGEWDLTRYAEAAGLLGALSALHPVPWRGEDVGLRRYCAGPVADLYLPRLD